MASEARRRAVSGLMEMHFRGEQSRAERLLDSIVAVAREEVGRAAHDTPEVSDKPRSGARVSTGVRVRVTEEAASACRDAFWGNMECTASGLKAAAPHMEVMVDLETLDDALLAWSRGRTNMQGFARRLGLTLTDGDSDA